MRVLIIAFVFACGNGKSSPPTTTPSGSAASGTKATDGNILAGALRAKICKAEPCGGDESSINVYRDADGNIKKLYRLYGPCSHNPGIYFDPDGTITDTIPEEPIVSGSPEHKALEARHAKQVGGLTMSDVIRCRDGARLPPR